MSCKEIAENMNYSTELLKEVKSQSTRYFISLVIALIVCGMLVAYIVYDRHMDSLVEVSATEVTQDGQGFNSYINGIGDIYNGTKSDNN